MKLLEYEQYIKKMIKNNRNDPEIYNKLQEMIYMFLRRKKAGNDEREAEEVSYTMAGDMFLSILQDEPIDNFLGYIDKNYHQYYKDLFYRFSRFNEPFDPTYDEIKSLEAYNSEKEIQKVIDHVFLEDISLMIDHLFENNCKYLYNTKAFINLKLSLLLSLLRGQITTYHLEDDQKEYLSILIVLFYNQLNSSTTSQRCNFVTNCKKSNQVKEGNGFCEINTNQS